MNPLVSPVEETWSRHGLRESPTFGSKSSRLKEAVRHQPHHESLQKLDTLLTTLSITLVEKQVMPFLSICKVKYWTKYHDAKR